MGGIIGDVFEAVGLIKKPPKPQEIVKAPDPIQVQADLNKEEAMAADKARRARRLANQHGYAGTLLSEQGGQGAAGQLLGQQS
jgi:hypothetical protein